MPQRQGSQNLEDLLDSIDAEVGGDAKLEVQDLLDAFGSRAFGGLLAAAALLVLTPVGAIPTVPSVLALFVVLVSVQHLLGCRYPWVPKAVRERGVSTHKWESARDRVRPWARRFDRVIRPRWEWFTRGAMERLISALALVAAALMVPLELLPFAAYLPALGLLLLGLSLSARDGLLAVAGLAVSAGAAALVYYSLVA